MTKVDDTEVKKSEGLTKRLNRRSLLRAGAIAAPVALTLHGGVPLAHADSAGMCVMQLMEIANKSGDARSAMLQVPMSNGKIAKPNIGYDHKTEIHMEDYDLDPAVRIEPFNADDPHHWQFLSDPANNRYGFSCVNSIGMGNFKRI